MISADAKFIERVIQIHRNKTKSPNNHLAKCKFNSTIITSVGSEEHTNLMSKALLDQF